jgi:hypothetical protein
MVHAALHIAFTRVMYGVHASEAFLSHLRFKGVAKSESAQTASICRRHAPKDLNQRIGEELGMQ